MSDLRWDRDVRRVEEEISCNREVTTLCRHFFSRSITHLPPALIFLLQARLSNLPPIFGTTEAEFVGTLAVCLDELNDTGVGDPRPRRGCVKLPPRQIILRLHGRYL